MKFLVLFSCALAAATAGWAPNNYGYHIPVLGPNGVPQETPEVQAARASHLAALSDAAGRGGGHNSWNDGGNNGAWNDGGNSWNDGSRPEDLRYYGPHAYQTTHGGAHVSQDGVPQDTPEVAAAKANHFGAFSEALSRAGPAHGHYRKRRSLYAGAWAHGIHIPVIGPLGVPLDTPEVQHARAAHLGALAAAGGHGHGYAIAAPILAHSHGFYGLDHDGRPLDTPEVAHAKAAHYAAYNSAATLNGVGHAGLGLGHVAAYHGGVPVDTPEVQHAKAAHFAAHAAARGHY